MGTFLKKEFDTLLNSVAITTDNRIIPAAHMLHKGHENSRNNCMFLDLVKRYVPVGWNKTRIMCDQFSKLEGDILKVSGTEALTCSIHLLKCIQKRISGSMGDNFKIFIHSLDKEECSKSQKEIEKLFHDSAKTVKNPTWKKVAEKLHLFCRSHRTDSFEQFTTNSVEQFHSYIGKLKRGNMINLISQLSMMQLSGLNSLAHGNEGGTPFTTFGSTILSVNISLALLFSVEMGEGSFFLLLQQERETLTYMR